MSSLLQWVLKVTNLSSLIGLGASHTTLAMKGCNGNHCVHILNSDLSYVDTFGKEGSDKRQYKEPAHLACDRTGHVYVADYGNHCIQVFTAEGNFLRMFRRYGKGRGEWDNPHGVAVSSGMVYVSEVSNDHVSVFTSDGQFVTFFGKRGSEPGQFGSPRGLAVDNSGVMYVCDKFNRQVKLF